MIASSSKVMAGELIYLTLPQGEVDVHAERAESDAIAAAAESAAAEAVSISFHDSHKLKPYANYSRILRMQWQQPWRLQKK